MRHIKQQGSFQKYHLFPRHKRENYNFRVHFEQFGRTFVKFNCFLKARLNPVFNIQTPTMYNKLHQRTKPSHLHAQGRPVHIAPFPWRQRNGAASSRWRPVFWGSSPAPASCGRCTHPPPPPQPGSAAPHAAPGSLCIDGLASYHISYRGCSAARDIWFGEEDMTRLIRGIGRHCCYGLNIA